MYHVYSSGHLALFVRSYIDPDTRIGRSACECSSIWVTVPRIYRSQPLDKYVGKLKLETEHCRPMSRKRRSTTVRCDTGVHIVQAPPGAATTVTGSPFPTGNLRCPVSPDYT
jgi:hypothetical protein